MSSYFNGVAIGEELISSLKLERASKVVEASTYVGVAPELTTVLYSPGDTLGLLSALASLIPIFICVALLTVFLCRRTAEDLWVGIGQIMCEIANGALKIAIKQPRPSSPVSNMPADSYGMPSAHAQYMGYFTAIIIIQTLGAKGISRPHRNLRIVSVTLLSLFTAYSRYYLWYHSGAQVSVGYLAGVALGFVWYKLGDVLRALGFVKWGLSLWPCRMMLVKDVRYSVADEYTAYKNQDTAEKKSQ